MLGHKLTDADSSTRQEFPSEATKETIPAWPLDTEWPIRLGGRPEQAKNLRIRVILALVWLSVMGMWLSFPVVDLKESTSRLGSVLLRYQNLAYLDHPLTPFLLSSMAFSLTSVALASNIGKVEGSLAPTLVADSLAVFAGLHFGLTPLQSLLLVLPLSTVSVLTTIVVLKGTPRKSHRKSFQHDNYNSHTSPKSAGKNAAEC